MSVRQPTVAPQNLTFTCQSAGACEPSSTHQSTTARITQRPARPSWIVTPPGSPSVALMGDIPPQHTMSTLMFLFFNFTQPVQDFLHQWHALAAMLCKVDATLNYSMSC